MGKVNYDILVYVNPKLVEERNGGRLDPPVVFFLKMCFSEKG